MKRLLAAVGALALVAALTGLALSTLPGPDPASAFRASPSPLLEAAADLGWTAQRLDANPSALANDAGVRPEATVLVIIAPDEAYDAADRAAVRAFVEDGGLLLLADDGGQGNTLLKAFGLAIERVRLVEATPGWSWGIDAPAIVPLLPSPTAVLVPQGSAATTLASSSGQSYLDRDGTGVVDAGDALGPFPVIVRQPLGQGAVLLVADAQAMQGDDGVANVPWIAGLLDSERPEGAVLLVDESWMAKDGGLTALAWLRTSGSEGTSRLLLGGAAVVAVVPLLLRQAEARWGSHRFQPLRFLRRARAQQPRARSPTWSSRGAVAIGAIPPLALGWALFGSRQAGLAAGLLATAVGMAFLVHVPRLSASRILSQQRTVEGSAVAVSVTLQGNGKGRAVELRDALPPELDVVQGAAWTEVRPRAGASLAYSVAPAVRGEHRIGPMTARRQDVLGLRHAHVDVVPASVLEVVPRAVPSRRAPFAARVPAVTMGPHRVNRAGDGTEFHALRPYLAGDPFRSVNWKASARTKDLMVNQRVHESRTCLTLVLDARGVAAAGPAARTPFARSCRAVLSVAMGAVRMRDRVRFVSYGDGVQELPVRPAARQVHEISETLARLEPRGETDLEAALAHVLPSLRPGNPVIVVSCFEKDLRAPAALSRLRGRGIPVWVLSPPPLTDPVDADEGGAEPGAHEIAREREAVLAGLRSAGIPLYEVAAEIPLDDLFRMAGAS